MSKKTPINQEKTEKYGFQLSQRASESKRQIGRSVSINDVNAVNLNVKRSQNLEDPILDVNLKVNNPIGRLWLALKRIWKSQNTIVDLRFTIPLIVLPILLYAGWRLWQGRGVNVPMSKLGVIHTVSVASDRRDVLILPSSDVYLLEYSESFRTKNRLVEKPVIVIGTYSNLKNTLYVDDVFAYNELDIKPSSLPDEDYQSRSVWSTVWNFIQQFK